MLILDGVLYVRSSDIDLVDFQPFTRRRTKRGATASRFQPYALMRAYGYTFTVDGMKDMISFVRFMDSQAQKQHITALMRDGGFDESGNLVDTFFDILYDLLEKSNVWLGFSLSFPDKEQKRIWRDESSYHAKPLSSDVVENKFLFQATGHVNNRLDNTPIPSVFMDLGEGRWVVIRNVYEGEVLVTPLIVTHGKGCFRPERSFMVSNEKSHIHVAKLVERMLNEHKYPPVESELPVIWGCKSIEVDDLEFRRYAELFQ